MPQLLNAQDITLADLQERWGVHRVTDADFLSEFKDGLQSLSELELLAVERIKQNFLDQLQSRLLIEETVKLVVIAPLLDLAGFYRAPYQIQSEAPLQLAIPDEEGGFIQGRIDILVVRQSLWIVLVEAKRTQISVHTGIPQALTYLLGRPTGDRPGYALVTNGSEFVFLKQLGTAYATSNLFSLINEGNDLGQVLQLLRRLG